MSGHGYRDVQLHDARLYRGGTARGAQTFKFWVKMFGSSLQKILFTGVEHMMLWLFLIFTFDIKMQRRFTWAGQWTEEDHWLQTISHHHLHWFPHKTLKMFILLLKPRLHPHICNILRLYLESHLLWNMLRISSLISDTHNKPLSFQILPWTVFSLDKHYI